MKREPITRAILRTISLLFLFVSLTQMLHAQSPWTATSVTFRPVGITTNGSTFWAYGGHEGIASSIDGREWLTHPVSEGSQASLLGLSFSSPSFGFAYGTGGALAFTTDGGQTWTARTVGAETILMASFADPDHGILRTLSSVYLYNGGTLQKVVPPKQVPTDFTYVPSVAALSPEHMAFTVSQGWRSRTGFVYTNDAGNSWQFFEPPHITVYQFLRVGDRYWAIGNETVDYDKPGGGYGVPALLSSQDGFSWQHAPADVHPCHWEGCYSCDVSGCLASSVLLIRPFAAPATLSGIPAGPLTANWAATKDRICTVTANLECAPLAEAADPSKPGPPSPEDRRWPALGEPKGKGLLRCISCSLDPVFIDNSSSGIYKVHLRLVVGADGVPKEVALENAPSPALQGKLTNEISNWLFEVPVKDGKAVQVSTAVDLTVRVLRPR